MKKKIDKTTLVTTLVCLLPIVLGVALFDTLPDQLPIHFNAVGEADGYAPKLLTILGLPCLMAALNLLLSLVMMNESKRANASKTLLAVCRWIIPVMALIIIPITVFVGMGYEIPIHVIVPTMVGVLIIICGNYLPKCKQNYTVGIKLPWTLSSEENWNRTHHMSGYLWVVVGIIMVVGSFMKSWLWLPLLFTAVAVMIMVPVAYSYSLYKKGI